MILFASAVRVTIRARESAQGHPFSEVHYVWTEGGEERYALTRYWYPLADNAHTRMNEAQQFIKRRNAA